MTNTNTIKLKSFESEKLLNLMDKYKDSGLNLSSIPLNEVFLLNTQKGFKDKSFKQKTSSVRNAYNTLLSKKYNIAEKEIKAKKVYSRNKEFCFINHNALM